MMGKPFEYGRKKIDLARNALRETHDEIRGEETHLCEPALFTFLLL